MQSAVNLPESIVYPQDLKKREHAPGLFACVKAANSSVVNKWVQPRMPNPSTSSITSPSSSALGMVTNNTSMPSFATQHFGAALVTIVLISNEQH
jgi:hypothetical protein